MKKKLYITPESSITPIGVFVMNQVSPDAARITDTPEGINLDNVRPDNGDAYNDAATNNSLWGWSEE